MLSESELLSRFNGVRRSGTGWMACCSHHDDSKASLSIKRGDTGWLLHCHAGCSFADVLAHASLCPADVSADETYGSSAVQAEYDYRDESNKLLYQVLRLVPKRLPPAAARRRWRLDPGRSAMCAESFTACLT